MSEAESLVRELVALLADVVDGNERKTDETCDLLAHVEDWLTRQGRRRKPFTVIPGGRQQG